MAATAALLGLEKTSLREQALVALRRAITTGDLEPGRHLVETELSEQLGISRGTLREALRQLQQEGLVSPGVRGRLSVRHLDAQEIRNIFAVRGALESLAAKTLVDQPRRAKSVGELRAAIEAMEDAEGRGFADRIEADLDFHRLLCRLGGNETLLHSWESLEGSIRMSIMFAGPERAMRNMGIERHRQVVDAIESGDATRAQEAIVQHMDDAAGTLVG